MRAEARPRLRRVVPWLAVSALLALALVTVLLSLRGDTQVERTVTADLQAQVRTRVSSWERTLLTDLEELMDRASDRGVPLAAWQAAQRRRRPWFDAVYVWDLAEDGAGAPRLLFPPDPAAMRAAMLAAGERCAEAVASAGEQDVQATLEAPLCAEAPAPVRAEAAFAAAQRLRDGGHAALALTLLDTHPTAPLSPAEEVLAPVLTVDRGLLRADLLRATGHGDEALDLLYATAATVTELDAPGLATTLFAVVRAVETLDEAGRATDALRRNLATAERRLAGWREVMAVAQRPALAGASEAGRMIADRLGDAGYVLYVRPADARRRGVALQLHEDVLIDDFLAHEADRLRPELLVLDASGVALRGEHSEEAVAATVPFRATLRDLSVGITQHLVRARVGPLRARGTLATGAVVGLCVVLGIGAIFALERANLEHRLLLQRQREFTARVTHELKTPLAGIKVMAENLALGAFRSEAQREEMADRIVTEADRLTARVEEILQVGREARMPDPEPFDLEEVILDLLEQWVPRYQDQHVALLADIEPTQEIVGHAAAVRDAIACLLDNALKYRREDVAPKVWLNVRQVGREAELEVVDNGLGVPRAQRQAIFERFVRVEGPGRGKAGGHGLGLAQVDEIVRRHRGRVACEDGVDGGARFVMRLPTS